MIPVSWEPGDAAVRALDGDAFTDWAQYDEREEMLAWLRFHGIDPMTVPRKPGAIVRDIAGRRVGCERFVYDPPERHGDAAALAIVDQTVRTRWEWTQGEVAPLPFPASAVALARLIKSAS